MLINCVAYHDGKKLADISIEEIPQYTAQPEAIVWVALKDPEISEIEQMQQQFHLHELAIEDACHGHQRPKIEEYGDSLFVVMHLVEMQENNLIVGEVNVFASKKYALSIRSRSGYHFLGVRQRCEQEPELLKQGAGFILYALMDAVVDRYFPILDMLESELETIEEKIFSKGSARSNIERLYELKRKVMILKHAVAPLAEAVGKLYGGRVPPVCIKTQEYFRDISDHLLRINSAIESMRDTIATAIHVNLSMVAIEESEVTKRLAAWAGIFAVATAFAGIWGMNFKNMPELDFRYGYPLALAIIAGTCSLLYYRFKRAGWI